MSPWPPDFVKFLYSYLTKAPCPWVLNRFTEPRLMESTPRINGSGCSPAKAEVMTRTPVDPPGTGQAWPHTHTFLSQRWIMGQWLSQFLVFPAGYELLQGRASLTAGFLASDRVWHVSSLNKRSVSNQHSNELILMDKPDHICLHF